MLKQKSIFRKLFDRLIKHRTTLIIAHRLSTIRNADQIIFLEDGKLMEKGNHKELVELGGKYSKFCMYQENFVPENA